MNVPPKREHGIRFDFSLQTDEDDADIGVEPLKISAHRGMSDFITNPKHGDSGWSGDQLCIYNGKHGRREWLKLRQYQKRKAEITKTLDWRISEQSGSDSSFRNTELIYTLRY